MSTIRRVDAIRAAAVLGVLMAACANGCSSSSSSLPAKGDAGSDAHASKDAGAKDAGAKDAGEKDAIARDASGKDARARDSAADARAKDAGDDARMTDTGAKDAGEDRRVGDSASDAGSYQQVCPSVLPADAGPSISWNPVAGQATVTISMFGFPDSAQVFLEGPSRVQVLTPAFGCFFYALPGDYAFRVEVGGTEVMHGPVTLAADALQVVPAYAAVGGGGVQVVSIDTSVPPAGKWRFSFVDVVQDVTGTVDTFVYPVGTAIGDVTTTTPIPLSSNVAFGSVATAFIDAPGADGGPDYPILEISPTVSRPTASTPTLASAAPDPPWSS